jgi:acetylserotonin N-methyltransferase
VSRYTLIRFSSLKQVTVANVFLFVMAASSEQNCNPSSVAPIPQKVFDILHGFCASQTLFTACELGIFDVLHTAGVPQSADKIAQQLSTNQDATCRLLDVLVSLELLVKHTTTDETLYSNSPSAHCLTKSSPMGYRARVMHIKRLHVPLISNLTSAVREGHNQWKRTFKTSSDDIFKNVCANQEMLISFFDGMRGYVKPAATNFMIAFDLSRFQRMCDLGGKVTPQVAQAHR